MSYRLADDAGHCLVTAQKQPARAPQLRKERLRVDDQRVEKSIIESRARRDDGVVAVLLAVGKDDEECAQVVWLRVEMHAVLLSAIREPLVQADQQVRQAAAAGEQVEALGHAGVEADARQIEEWMAVDLADVERAQAAGERGAKRNSRIAGDAKRGREAVARSGRHDPERDARPRKRARDFVDGAVASPRDDSV